MQRLLLQAPRRAPPGGARLPLDLTAPPSVVILGGLAMQQRALEKTAAALYPALAVRGLLTHSLNQIVNVNWAFAANRARLASVLEGAGPGGAIVHVFSGAAFFSLLALRDWSSAVAAAGGPATPASRIRGVVLDSIPYKRVESNLMAAAQVPPMLVPAATALASRVLVSPLIGATVALTDDYNRVQRTATTFACTGGRRVLVAHSAEDAIVPVSEFREYVGSLQSTPGWRLASQPAAHAAADGAAAVRLDVFEGKGRHAAMVLGDDEYVHTVRQWAASLCEP